MRGALVLAAIFGLAACSYVADAQQRRDTGGQPSQRSYNVDGFNGVSVAGPYNVIVNVGPGHSVRAEGDPELLNRLEVVVEGRSLQIRTRKGDWSRMPVRGKATVYVTLPAIEAASIAGSGGMRIDRVEGRSFSGSIAGSGDMDVDSLRVGEAKFSVAGSGGIRAAGAAAQSSVSVAGSGDVDLDRLETRTSSVSIAGSGDVRARASDTARVSIMGSGDVSIGGSARCSVSKMGSGSVRCGG